MHELILANPGTGKTTTLATRVVRLLKEDVQPKDILCITFTEKAANEMSQRIRELVAKEKLNVKLHELSIHTFHSYALSYLEEDGGPHEIFGNNAIRYSIFKSFEANNALNYSKEYIIGDIVPKVENAIRYIKSYGITPDAVNLKKCLPAIAQIYDEEGISNITLEEQLRFAEYFLQAFQNYENSKKNNHIDYNDMLINFVSLKEKKKFKFVLVDELQDVNELEAEIALQSGEELFLVGDRKQSIFGFQGGSIRNFKMIESKLNPKKEKLVNNYRSSKKIVDYATKHFKSKTKNKEYAGELEGFAAVRKDSGNIEIIETSKSQQELLAVKKALQLQDGKTTAIITRSNGQILSISKILDSKGVQYSTTISNATSTEAKASILAFMKGLLYDNNHSIVDALFTPFAGVRLKEAFEISKLHSDGKLDEKKLQEKADPFMKMRESAFSKLNLIAIFDNVILPISVSVGKDYYITASAIRKNISEFFDIVSAPQISDLFNYLDVTEESYEPIGQQEKLILTTVHKSKGLEFDNVIYVPRAVKNGFSFVDAVVYGIIKATKEINIKEELEEEHLRIDFVAFTRARDNLFIIANGNNASDYIVDGTEITKYETIEDEPEPLSRKYDETYNLFVNRRYEEAKNAINAKDHWLRNYIESYFSNTTKLSYTLIEGIHDPFNFLKRNILGLRDESIALNTGNMAHLLAENRFKGTLRERELKDSEKPYFENIKNLDHEMQNSIGAKQIEAELQIVLPLEKLLGSGTAYKDMEFKAKIDAVYKTKNGYIILDYKTDKTEDNAAGHRRQLAIYKKLYSIANEVEEDNISTALGFIALRGKINTGRLDWKLDTAQPKPQQYDTVVKHIKNFVAYKKDPGLFISDLIRQQDQGMLHQMAKQELAIKD